MSGHSEGIEFSTAQVQEGTAGLAGATGVVHTRCMGGSNSVVLSCAGVIPLYSDHVAATVQVNIGVLRLTWSYRGVKLRKASVYFIIHHPSQNYALSEKTLNCTHQIGPDSQSQQ